MDFQEVTYPVNCQTTHISMSSSLGWLHRVWEVRPPTRAAEKGLVGHCGPPLYLADPPNCFIPAAEAVWPVHSRQNFDNEMLSIALNYCESFRESVV